MTKLEKLRDQEAKEYAESCDNQSGSFLQNQLEAIRKKAFKAGWDAAMTIAQDELAKLKEREAKLVENIDKLLFALQCNIIKHNGKVPTMSDEQVFEASIEIRDQAKQALADHKRMMEGVE